MSKQERNSQELQQLEYEDVLVGLNSVCEQYGCRAVMMDFRDACPKMFEELVIQINRILPDKHVAALLKPPHAGSM